MQLDQWDEALRGKKMSGATGKVIFKYQMPVKEQFTMKLPQGAEIIRMTDQDGMFWLWAVVDTDCLTKKGISTQSNVGQMSQRFPTLFTGDFVQSLSNKSLDCISSRKKNAH